MSAKLATPGLFKTEQFLNIGYDVIILDYDLSNKPLSRDSSYIVEVVKLGNSSISIREIIVTSIL